MTRFIPRRRHKAGLSPGSLVPVDVDGTGEVRMQLVEYDASGVEERSLQTPDECRDATLSPSVSWVNVDGLHHTEVIAELQEIFGLHPLVAEDVLNTTQRPKLDDYEDYLFLVARMLTFDPDTRELQEEQVSMIVGSSWVLSFQELPGDVFDPVRERIRHGKGRLRTLGPDYLAYALLDAIVDQYFVALEGLGEWVEEVEEEVLADPTSETLEQIHRLKREVILLRKAAWPAREVANSLGRPETSLVTDEVRVFVRDLYDHTVQVIDIAETLRDLISGIRDTYLSSVSNRMNEIMKVLTVMASIFIPLTFIAGVYGMNFEFMPELGWRWAYPTVLGLMGVLALGLLLFFRLREWI